MQLQAGDWVRTEEGEVGQVTHIERMTAFVRLTAQSKDETVIGYLASKLTKIDQPDNDDLTAPFNFTFPCFVVEFANGRLLSMPADKSPCLIILTSLERSFRFVALVGQLGVKDIIPSEVKDEAELLKHVGRARRLGASCAIVDPRPNALPPTKFFYREISIEDVIQQLKSRQ